MKKPIIVSVIMALMLLTGGSFTPSYAQGSANEEKPTFYRLVPGVYVNGWPRFTIHYPKDWVEEKPGPLEVFRVTSPDPHPGEKFIISVYPYPQPLDHLADFLLLFWKNVAKDVTLVSDKPSQLQDGSPAREVELQMIMNTQPFNYFYVAMKKDDMWIGTGVGSIRGRIREDLKAIPYSIEFEPGKDEPVKVPPNIQEFLDSLRSAWVSHDLAKVMSHYSNKYLNSGVRKGEMEHVWRQGIGYVTSFEVCVTDLVLVDDRAHVAGFAIRNGRKFPLTAISIIKESGEWKFFGNQRDVSP